MKINQYVSALSSVKVSVLKLGVILLILAAMQYPAHASELQTEQERFVHIVVMWFEKDGKAEQRRRVIDATRGFKQIPGVLEIHVGEQVKEDNSTENPFSIAATILFENKAALQGYFDHPVHQAALKSDFLKGLVRVETYDFVDRR